jgi:hypothetical protein
LVAATESLLDGLTLELTFERGKYLSSWLPADLVHVLCGLPSIIDPAAYHIFL